MNKEEKFKLLEYSDVNKFLRFIQESNIDDIDSFFMSPSFTVEELGEVYIKKAIFEFNILVFGSFIDSELDKFVLFRMNDKSFNATIFSIEIMSKNIDNNLLNSALKFVKEKLKPWGFTKIKMTILRYQLNSDFETILLNARFKNELEFTYHEKKLDRLLYSYLL